MLENQEYLELIHGLNGASADICEGIDKILSAEDSVTMTVADLRVPLTAIKTIMQIQAKALAHEVNHNMDVTDHLEKLANKLENK